ncbi:MAG: ABC transporter permease [Oscillospiraceae bacterium]|nr:ABC transporter permease [Oscillospiraceae bacterium]
MLKDILALVFTTTTFAATFRLACPILYGAMGGCFNNTSGCVNIAYEAVMLYSCFFSVVGSYLTGNPWIGMLFGILIGLVIASIFGLMAFVFNANTMITGIALNSSAWAVTTLMMVIIFGVRGSVYDERIVSFKPIHFKFLEKIPILNDVLNDNVILVYIAFSLVAVAYVVMYHTPFGLRIRGVGQNAQAAYTAGVDVTKYRWISLLLMGAFTAISGTSLTLSGISMFSENMTAGKGFLCMCSITIGKGNPLKILFVALLFAFSQALVLVLGTLSIPTQIISMIPYVAVILVLFGNGLKSFKGTADIEG